MTSTLASWLVKQPNARLGVFSESMAHFSVMGLTESEALDDQSAAGYTPQHARARVDAAIRDEPLATARGATWRAPGGPVQLRRWALALQVIEDVHGRGEAVATRAIGEARP